MNMPLLRSAELRVLEAAHGRAMPPLMARAGAAAFQWAARLQTTGRPNLIFVGPGNNGGDALTLAALQQQQGLAPTVVMQADPGRLPDDARAAYAAWQAAGGREVATPPAGTDFGLLVDGLFGIGLTRPIGGIYAEWIALINARRGPVLALDCPSGLDADSGAIVGNGAVVRASHTLSFIALKPGLLTLDGPDHCGIVSVDGLGLEAEVNRAASGRTLGTEDFAACLQPRRANSHKGSYGAAAILGGAPGMAGAALLAGRAALKLGAGRVYVGMLERLAVDAGQPELMLREPQQALDQATAIAIGPGLGASVEALALLRSAIHSDKPLLVDADGINLLAAHPSLQHHLARRAAPTVLTPHPLEAARLANLSLAEIQRDRVQAALDLAARFRCPLVLKGNGSVIAEASGRWRISTRGNPGLASAGSGDVLSGFIVALLAQGLPAFEALCAGVYLHGTAAEQGPGPIGLTASELIEPARLLRNRLG